MGDLTLRPGHMTLYRILQNHAFTKGLEERQLDALARLATEIIFEENELILMEGQRSQSFYLVTDGSVAVELRTPAYAVCIQALAPGQVFGWSALLQDHDTLFQVRARDAPRPYAWTAQPSRRPVAPTPC